MRARWAVGSAALWHSAAVKTSSAVTAEDCDYPVDIDACHAGPVRITFRRQKAKRGKHSHWFWSAKRAAAI